MWIVFALAASLLWGLVYSLSERLFKAGISPAGLIAIEMFLGGLLLLIFFARPGKFTEMFQILAADRALLAIAVIDLCCFVIGSLCIALSINARNATLAGLIEISYPVFIVLFSWLLFGELQLTLPIVAGSSLIFSGIAVIYLAS